MMAGLDEFGNDGRTDKACRTGKKNAHVEISQVVTATIRPFLVLLK
jgi:hypothetical protein